MDIVDVRVTEDGSQTVYSAGFNASYHSLKGAVTESNHVFIEAGLRFFSQQEKSKIRIFEMGFGTGLNVHLTSLFALKNNLVVDYTSIEAYPLPENIWSLLHYPETESQKDLFFFWHTLPWNLKTKCSDHFTLTKVFGKIEDYIPDVHFDIIYYDAFGPGTQPELWTDSIMEKMYNMLESGGILITYCAQGEFKRALKRNQFSVTSLPGPPGKREIVRAVK
jgi:tRNA U34 5-methylaminomethyl-2-thiouridine-forming methyltransferase MnmC